MGTGRAGGPLCFSCGSLRGDGDGGNRGGPAAEGDGRCVPRADSPQLFRRKIDEKSLCGKVPLLLLFGKGEITELFRVEEAVPRKGGGETALRLRCRRR